MENNLPAANLDLAAPTATTPKLKSGVQDRAIEKYIRDAGHFLEEARISPDILETLQAYGFTDEELSVGMSLQNEALNAYYEQRGNVPTNLDAATKELEEKIDKARDEYAGFRLVARAAFAGMDDRVNLRVLGDAPEDLQRFMNKAHLAYTAAGDAPYAEKLTKRGYDSARLAGMLEFLDALTWLDAAHDAAEEAAEPETQTDEPLDVGEEIHTTASDAAYLALKDFMKEIKGVARAAFRKQPEALEKLKLTE